MKFDPSGAAQWTTVFSPFTRNGDVAIAGDHLVYASEIYGDTDFGLGTAKAPAWVVVALNELDGSTIWQTSGASPDSTIDVETISANPAGTIAAVTPGSTAEYDPTGGIEWYQGPGAMASAAIAIDEGGTVYTAMNGALTKRRADDGTALWSIAIPATDIALVGDRVVVGGEFEGSITLDVTHTSNGSSDLFAASIDAATGAYAWSTSWGATDRDGTARVASVGSGSVVSFQLDLSIGVPFAIGGVSLTRRDAYDGSYVLAFDRDGAPQWGRPLGMRGAVNSIAATPSGEITVAGYFSGEFHFDTAVFVGRGDAIMSDAFVARYAR